MSLAVYHPQSSEAQRELEMALRDRQILAYLEQFGSDVAETVFDFVKAYRARLARGTRLVLKGHLSKGSVIDYWLNQDVLESPERFFQQRRDTWKSLRLNWTPRERRHWELRERNRDGPLIRYQGFLIGRPSWVSIQARQWGDEYFGA